jgi:hypothetical protein
MPSTTSGTIGQSGTTSSTSIRQSGTTSTSSIGQSGTTSNPSIGGTTGTQASGSISSATTFGSTANDTQVTTIVQQIDTEGPAVVEKITTHFADVTCTPENARLIVEGLRNGTDITLSANGATATFKPAGARLGYGEAYITLALAAEALRNAGVTGCATPDQWKAVLIGGPLAASGSTSTGTSTTTTASSSSHFPGILTLRSQGQGWGQVAQTTNVQLGSVISGATSSLKLSGDSGLTPTGKTSAEMMRERMNAGKGNSDTSATGQDDDKGRKGKGKAKGHENNPDSRKDSTTGPSTSPNP